MTTTLSGPAPAAAYAGESLPASTPPVNGNNPSRRAGGGRMVVRPKLSQAEAAQLALSDHKTDAGAERYIRRLGGEVTIKPDDIPRLQRGCWLILDMMLDGQWHSYDEIQEASGGLRSSDRRRRQLSDVACDFESEDRGRGDWWHRLLNAGTLAPEVINAAREARAEADSDRIASKSGRG